jgi:hypothetical protein
VLVLAGRPIPPPCSGEVHPNPLGVGWIVRPLERTASAQSATRRAVASLRTIGLIEARKADRSEVTTWLESLYYQGKRERPTGNDPWHRQSLHVTWAWRTVFGEMVAALFHYELDEPGHPIRWDDRLDLAESWALARCPHHGDPSMSEGRLDVATPLFPTSTAG